MEDVLEYFLESVGKNDFATTSKLLNDILVDAQAEVFAGLLKQVIEFDNSFTQYNLKIRDHIFDYFECQGLYFALRMPSYDLLNLVSDKSEKQPALRQISDYIYQMNKQDDPILDTSFIDIDVLKGTKFVVLIPSILMKREEEIFGCKIYYSQNPNAGKSYPRYSIFEVLQTNYGRKLAAALDLSLRHSAIGGTGFFKLRYALFTSFNLDVENMLIEVNDRNWLHLLSEQNTKLMGENLDSREMKLVHEVAYAQEILGANHPVLISEAFEIIRSSKTKCCNYALFRYLSNGSKRYRVKAIQTIQDTSDFSQVDNLSSLVSTSTGDVRAAISGAVSSLLAKKFTSSLVVPMTKTRTETVYEPPSPEVLEDYYRSIQRLAESSSILAKIDAIRALSAFNIPGMEAPLKRMMGDSNPNVRFAVVEVAEGLPKTLAQSIVSLALNDDDPAVVEKATEILEDRWPDDFW